MKLYYGSIEDCLAAGEYDQGDKVELQYDELYDLVEQARLFKDFLMSEFVKPAGKEDSVIQSMQRLTNRPLHPCLGGQSPYSSYLPL